MKKVLLAAVVFLLAALCGYSGYRWRDAESRLDKSISYTHSLMDSLATTVTLRPPPMFAERDSLYWKWMAINAQMSLEQFRNAMHREERLRQHVLEQYEIEQLKKEGLAHPVNDLRASLMARPDLIPFDGVLGGTMGFAEPYIVLLRRPYVFADFDDGHIVGSMLLTYSIADSTIEWKRLWAELE